MEINYVEVVSRQEEIIKIQAEIIDSLFLELAHMLNCEELSAVYTDKLEKSASIITNKEW